MSSLDSAKRNISQTAYERFDQHAVGGVLHVSVAGFAAVEAKDELIPIGLAPIACDADRRRLAPIL